MASVYPLGKYRKRVTSLASTSETQVSDTVTGRIRHSVVSIRAATADGSAKTLTLRLYDAAAAAHFTIFKDKDIPANDALNEEFYPIPLSAGDTILATGSASGIDIVLVYLDDGTTNT